MDRPWAPRRSAPTLALCRRAQDGSLLPLGAEPGLRQADRPRVRAARPRSDHALRRPPRPASSAPRRARTQAAHTPAPGYAVTPQVLALWSRSPVRPILGTEFEV